MEKYLLVLILFILFFATLGFITKLRENKEKEEYMQALRQKELSKKSYVLRKEINTRYDRTTTKGARVGRN